MISFSKNLSFLFLALLGFILFFLPGCKNGTRESEPVTRKNPSVAVSSEIRDIDSNLYHSVKIGKQEWLVENLRVTRYQNGNPIPDVQDGVKWRQMKTGAFCNYDNEPVFAITFGRLYNWYAVDDPRKICPKGWHVPSDEEWFDLTSSLGGEGVAGGKMKEAGTNHWSFPNEGATNESGFKSLPGGYRGNKGRFQILDDYTFYWTTTSFDAASAWSRFLQNNDDGVNRIENFKTFGFSVRCVKDK